MKNHYYSFNSIDDPAALVHRGLEMKQKNIKTDLGKNKTIGLVFLNPSLRTRMSTHEAANRLSMHVITFNGQDAWSWEMEDGAVMNVNKTEHIKDAARVISSYVDIIGIRCFAGLQDITDDRQDSVIKKFMQYSSVPVINLESAALHPCQSLADMITMQEIYGDKKLKVALSWAPHPKALPQAVAQSFSQWAIGMGHEVVIAHPEGYNLDSSYTKGALITQDQAEAIRDADIVYTKSWTSEIDYGKSTTAYNHWTIDEHKMAIADGGKFMHCLPIRRNVVATDGVLDGAQSLIYSQAENRLYAAQAVIENILKSTK